MFRVPWRDVSISVKCILDLPHYPQNKPNPTLRFSSHASNCMKCFNLAARCVLAVSRKKIRLLYTIINNLSRTSIKVCSRIFFCLSDYGSWPMPLGPQASSVNSNADNDLAFSFQKKFFQKVFKKYDFSWYRSVGYKRCFIIGFFSHHQILAVLN